METFKEPSAETLKIENALKVTRPGEFISYKNIEQFTGVRMDNRGKGFLRTALNRLRLEYTPLKGKGIQLASAETAIAIVSRRVIKIDNSVKRAEKTTKRISNQFYDKLSEPEQKTVNFLSSIFSALRSYSRSAKTFFKKEEHKAIN